MSTRERTMTNTKERVEDIQQKLIQWSSSVESSANAAVQTEKELRSKLGDGLGTALLR